MKRVQALAATKDITIYSGTDQAPTMLQLLGEHGYWRIPVKASEVEEARRLFPGAQLSVIELDVPPAPQD